MTGAAIFQAVVPLINSTLQLIGSKQQYNFQQATVNADAYWNWGIGEYTEENTANTTGMAVFLAILVVLIVALTFFREPKK
jgi:hypothetical protein|tara:strand:+ start:3953 stop:4195 length:243 start_codon:yes stop_codon:yes gene_type:complete